MKYCTDAERLDYLNEQAFEQEQAQIKKKNESISIEDLFFLTKQQLEAGEFYSCRKTLDELIKKLESKK